MDVEERIAQFKNMTEADPDNEMGHFSLGRAYMEAERFAEAESCFARVLELNPTHSKSYEFLGLAQLKLDKREEAVTAWKRGYEVAAERGDVMPRDNMARMLTDVGESPPKMESASAQVPTSSSSGAATSDGFRCSRCGRPHGQLAERPFKGELGEKVLASVCTECWREWIGMGTKVINEMGLALADPRAQDIYDEHMREFLQLPE